MDKKIQNNSSKIKHEVKGLPVLVFIVILSIFSVINLKIRPLDFFSGFSNLVRLFDEATLPDPSLVKTSFVAVFETLQIAFLGTILGTILSLPFSLLSSKNLFDNKITVPARMFLALIRTFPSLLWAIFFVIIVGLGPFAGVLATMMYTMGHLSKLQYEAFESVNRSPIEAISVSGATKLQLIRFVIIPESINTIISQILFIFEYNVRASSILGFVGAGGIGFYIAGYLKLLEYNKVITLLIGVFVIVVIIDFISLKIRKKFL